MMHDVKAIVGAAVFVGFAFVAALSLMSHCACTPLERAKVVDQTVKRMDETCSTWGALRDGGLDGALE